MNQNQNREMTLNEKVEAMRAEMQSGQYVHTFREPVQWEGKTYASLSFDFAVLKGADALKIEEEMAALGMHPAVRKLDMNYQMRVASRSCGEKLGVDFFESLPIGDFEKILARVQGFLLRAE